MLSVHPSRSRILFEVFCALVVAASCVGAWVQSGVSALLPAAAASALYALVHAFDLRARHSAEALKPQPAEYATVHQPDPLIVRDAVVGLTEDSAAPMIANVPEEAECAAPSVSSAKVVKRAKSPRKSNARRPRVAKKAEISELPSNATPTHFEAAEAAHPHIATLFEPEPYVRMQRPAFGRKAG